MKFHIFFADIQVVPAMGTLRKRSEIISSAQEWTSPIAVPVKNAGSIKCE